MKKSEQFLSPKRILSATLFAGILALGAANEVKATADPTDTTSTTVATPDTSTTVATFDISTPPSYAVSGDVYCPVDDNLYSIDGPIPIPENCNDQPTTTPLSKLPSTGIDLEIALISAGAIGAGSGLVRMSKRSDVR